MDSAQYRVIADQLGACAEERDHALACARWDLQHRPHEVHGSDPYAYAARLLTAARALPERHLEPVEFERTKDPAWTPGQALAARRR